MLVMCWPGTVMPMAHFPSDTAFIRASALMLSAKVVLFADKRGGGISKCCFLSRRTSPAYPDESTKVIRTSICPQKRSVLHLPTQRAPLAIAARCIGHRTALKQIPLLAASPFLFDCISPGVWAKQVSCLAETAFVSRRNNFCVRLRFLKDSFSLKTLAGWVFLLNFTQKRGYGIRNRQEGTLHTDSHI